MCILCEEPIRMVVLSLAAIGIVSVVNWVRRLIVKRNTAAVTEVTL